MPAKTPMYLKPSTPKRGKKLKLRDVLSGDMISPPLGDVRHSAHVGREGEGDMFGDVGFLQGKLDMLPALSQAPSRVHSAGHGLDEPPYPPGGPLLKGTVSMPAFAAPEQAPPKPPRLHLDETPPPTRQSPSPLQQPRSMSVCDAGVRLGGVAYAVPGFPPLLPSSGSFSEASSDDSALDGCAPLDPRRGLSLDSDAGLSSEDLRSERSESPAVARSESLLGLDLDLGPSILEDVLRIMDRYKTAREDCEL